MRVDSLANLARIALLCIKERADSLGAMKAIKKALDPKNIMNPGKMFDWEGSIIYELRYPAFLEDKCAPAVEPSQPGKDKE